MDSGISNVDSAPRPALVESFLPCSALALAHGLEREFLGFCRNFVWFKADSIYFSISHMICAVWIPLV